ncbi:MAG: APC family permease [Henriciella sp.]
MAFGAIIGVSWIILVGEWIESVGAFGAIIAFTVGGLSIVPIGLCYAWLGKRMPTTGGEFVYAYKAFGSVIAYWTSWVLVLLYVSLCAFEAISIAWIISATLPAAMGPELYSVFGQSIAVGDLVAGVVVTILLAFAHLRGAELASIIQDALTISMAVLSVVFIGAAIWGGTPENLSPAFVTDKAGKVLPGLIVLIIVTPLFFAGFGAIPQALGESGPKAKRRLGLIITAVLLAAVVFYAAVIFATAYVLPVADIAELELPAAEALQRAFGRKWLADLVLFAGMLGLLTTWNAVLFAGSRALFALGRSGLAPYWLSAGSEEFGAPRNAILLITLVTLTALPLGRQALLPIVSLGGLAVSYLFLIVALSALKLLPSHRVSALLAVFISIGLFGLSAYQLLQSAISGRFAEVSVLLAWFLVGIALWVFSKKSRSELSEPARAAIIVGDAQNGG